MNPYIEIFLDDKIYAQRTPTSKFIRFNKNGIKEKSYEELPDSLKEFVDTAKDMERNPDYYFTYEVKDGQAEILDIKNFNLPYLKIPETINNLPVYKINKTAFNKSFARNLYQVQLPDTITCFDDNCFNGMYSLRFVNIPVLLKEIPKYCFNKCYNLRNVNLENIKVINSSAFSECNSITKIYLPNIEHLDSSCFYGCSSLKEVYLNDELTIIPNLCFSMCFDLSKINFPNALERVESLAFVSCNIEEFIAPENLKHIKDSAFATSALKRIRLNKKLETIGDDAFAECEDAEVIMYATTKYEKKSFRTKNIKILGKAPDIER